MTDNKKIAEIATSTGIINLNVLGQDNAIVQFKIRKLTPLRNLMNAYCYRAGLSTTDVGFSFDGQPINSTDTSTSLEMKDGDTIEVYTTNWWTKLNSIKQQKKIIHF